VWFPAPNTAGLGLRRFDAARRLHFSRFGKKCPAYRNQRRVPINSGKLKMNCSLTNKGHGSFLNTARNFDALLGLQLEKSLELSGKETIQEQKCPTLYRMGIKSQHIGYKMVIIITSAILVSMHCMKHPESGLRLTHKYLMFNGNAIMAGFMLCLPALASLYSGRWCSSAGNGFRYHLNPRKSCDVVIGPI
jgi:hypothetical protein